jgi:type IV pilus assembly protein PilC
MQISSDSNAATVAPDDSALRLADAPPAVERRRFPRRQPNAAAATAPAPSVKRTEPTTTPWYRNFSVGSKRHVSPETVMAFSRQLASFLEAGISVLEALEIVGEESAQPGMQRVIEAMIQTIQRGGSFTDATAEHPDVFPAYYRAMVRSAEFTGRLDEVLDQLAVYLDRDLNARRQVKSALAYPSFVFLVAVVGMIVMSIFVLPKFNAMYAGLGAELPLPTRLLMNSTGFITGGWMYLVGGAALFGLIAAALIGGARGKSRRDRFVMRLPVLGELYHLISIERFCRVLASLAKAGVPLPDAISMAADSTNNTVFQTRMVDVRDTLTRGGGLSAPIVESEIFPTAARQMIRVGERTGALAHQLSRAASYYEREVGFKMKRATELFEPAVILFVGLLIGFVAIAQVAAMYSIFGQVRV